MAQDLYAILGVPKNADDAALKRAYRKLAKELHPDRNAGNPRAEARFKEVNRAYDVLGDEKKRRLYDEFGEEGLREGFDPERARAYRRWGGAPSGRGGATEVPLEDLFGGGVGDMFGDLFGRGRRASRKGQDIRSEVTIDLRSAIQGTVVELARPGAEPTKVRLPPGAIEGTTLRIAGQGAPGRNGGEPGDLLLVVHVGPHPHFRLEGADLHLDVPISIAEAYLGAKVKVPTVDGAVTVKVPERTQSGTVLRVRGKGVPRKGKDAGDLYVHFMVHVPREAHPDLKALMERLASFQATDLREGIAF